MLTHVTFTRAARTARLVPALLACSLPALAGLPTRTSLPTRAAAPAYNAVDVTLKGGTGQMKVALSSQAAPALGMTNPPVRGGVAYVAASHDVGEWNVGLSPKLPLSLNVTHEVGSTQLNLVGLPLTALEVSSGTGEMVLNMPARTFTADLTQSVGSLDVYLPANTGLKLVITRFDTGTFTLAGKEVASGQALTGSYQTANYDAARNKVTLNLAKDSGKVNIHAPGTK